MILCSSDTETKRLRLAVFGDRFILDFIYVAGIINISSFIFK